MHCYNTCTVECLSAATQAPEQAGMAHGPFPQVYIRAHTLWCPGERGLLPPSRLATLSTTLPCTGSGTLPCTGYHVGSLWAVHEHPGLHRIGHLALHGVPCGQFMSTQACTGILEGTSKGAWSCTCTWSTTVFVLHGCVMACTHDPEAWHVHKRFGKAAALPGNRRRDRCSKAAGAGARETLKALARAQARH